ncbi:MAG: endonuclease/exonuclease/phosphatase family protein, partial [Pseudomonadota bacterium]
MNARSIVRKLDELSLLIATTSPSVIIVCESWLHPGISDDSLSLQGFNLLRCDRIDRVGGGVCMWIRSDLACSRVTLLSLPSSVEAIVIKIPRIKLLLISAYIPPNISAPVQKDISEFFTLILDQELSLCPDLKMMICGDFNTFDSRIFEQNFSLYNCVKAPTRQASFLDQIWISCNLRDFYNDEAVIGPPLDSSDHQTVFLFSNQSFCKVKKIVKLWDFRRSNVDRFLYLLSITNFSSILESGCCVDELCQVFYEHLDVAMSFVPSSYVMLSTSDKPWITPLLKHLINERWKAFRGKDWRLYQHYKDKVKREIKKAKTTWARRQISSSKHIWKVVNEIRGSKRSCNLQTLINEFGSKESMLA